MRRLFRLTVNLELGHPDKPAEPQPVTERERQTGFAPKAKPAPALED